MKKQIIFTGLMLGCISSAVFSAAEKSNKGERAFRININGWASVVERYDRDNIPHTNKINGKHFGDWIRYAAPMRTDNVSVVKQSEDGTFGQERALDSFNKKELEKCEYEVAPFRTFEQSYRSMYAGNRTERSAYEPEHLSFIEQIQSDKCVLCMFNDKQVIVAGAKGLPQEVCKALELKRSADIDQKFKKNIGRSWKKAAQDKAAVK